MAQADTQVVLGSALMFIRVCRDWCLARQGDVEDDALEVRCFPTPQALPTRDDLTTSHFSSLPSTDILDRGATYGHFRIVGAYRGVPQLIDVGRVFPEACRTRPTGEHGRRWSSGSSTWTGGVGELTEPDPPLALRTKKTDATSSTPTSFSAEKLDLPKAISTLLGATPGSRLQLTRSESASDAIASLVLLTHETAGSDVSLASIASLELSFPAVIAALTAGRGTDEAMSWILSCLRPGIGTGAETSVVPVTTALPEGMVLPLTSVSVQAHTVLETS